MSFIFEYGKPGSGKTTLAASMTKLGYKVRFIDIDDKVRQMVNLRPLLEQDKIRVTTLKSGLTQVNLRTFITQPKVALLKQPGGYLEYCDIISRYEEMLVKGEPVEEQVLVTDSMTSLQEHMKRLISHLQGKAHFTYDEWAITLSNLEEYFDTMRRLQGLFKHVIIIAHEMTERDETEGKIETLPLIEGSMRNKVGKYFEEIYYTQVEIPKAGQAIYKVLTKASDRYSSRTSRNLNTWELADFEILFKEELPEEKRQKLAKLEELKKLKKGAIENGNKD